MVVTIAMPSNILERIVIPDVIKESDTILIILFCINCSPVFQAGKKTELEAWATKLDIISFFRPMLLRFCLVD